MTLVLSCITSNFVVQVSDRRLTRPDGTLYDDDTNKAVMLHQKMLFAYTGLGYIGRTKTHVWIANTLDRHLKQNAGDPSVAVRYLGEEAAIDFQRIPGPQLKRHAFVAVGWGALSNDPDRLRPFYLTISNALDPTGEWLPLADRQFDTMIHILPENEPFYLAASGQPLSAAEDASIRRNVRRALRTGRGQSAVSRLLATLVDVVASRNGLLGEGYLVSVLPIEAARQERFSFKVPVWSSSAFYPVDNAELTFIQVPADRSSPMRYIPTLVTTEGVVDHIAIDLGPHDT